MASGTTATPGTEAAAELERGADGSRRVVRREMGSAPGSARPLGAGVGIVSGPQDLRAASGRVGIRSGRNGFAAVSVAIKRFERRLIRDRSLRKTVESIEQLLNVET